MDSGKDNKRCAICGWPIGNCQPGDCSMRPFPSRYYDTARAKLEYAPIEIPDEASLSFEEENISNLVTRNNILIEAIKFYANSKWNDDYPGGITYKVEGDTGLYLDMGDKARESLAIIASDMSKKQ